MDRNEHWHERYEADGRAVRDGWLSALGPPGMPREVMMPVPGTKKKWNETVVNNQQYFRACERHAPHGDMWVAWSPSNQYDEATVDFILGDVDVDMDERAQQEALRLARRYEEKCMQDFGVQPPALFTAGKGYHMPMRCDPVPNAGGATSDAFQVLLKDSGLALDWGPLKSRHAKLRLPYSMNLKATGQNQHPMYVVPVDLSWDLDEIRRASADMLTRPFAIPKSPVLGERLAPLVEKEMERRVAMARSPRAGQQRSALVRAAIAFCETDGHRLVDGRGRPDGRRRVLQALYIPALMHDIQDPQEVEEAVQAWVETAGADWRDYRTTARDAIRRSVRPDGVLRSPMGLRRFFQENPGLRIGTTKAK